MKAYIQNDRKMYFDPNFVFENLRNAIIVNKIELLVEKCCELKQKPSSDNFQPSMFNQIEVDCSDIILDKIYNISQ